jgi:LPPG:FO 2-phospho-L-lactate transferase
MLDPEMNVVALAGGVGGAKLADGLAKVLNPGRLTVVVNTGDDFEHFGLRISPDLDTVCYTLAGIANPKTGWGRTEESWQAIDQAVALGGPAWFRLGDRDIGTHLERTRRLNLGDPLSRITADFCRVWGVTQRVIPMTDARVMTIVDTVDSGRLPFQNYFVEHRCEPRVMGFSFQGIDQARPAPGVLDGLREADLIVICPSNPWVSIAPILAVSGIREQIEKKPVVAVSPIIGGQAVKGPAAKMYVELGIQPSALAVAKQYGRLLDGFILDKIDREFAAPIQQSGIIPHVTETLMLSDDDRIHLASEVIVLGQGIQRRSSKL